MHVYYSTPIHNLSFELRKSSFLISLKFSWNFLLKIRAFSKLIIFQGKTFIVWALTVLSSFIRCKQTHRQANYIYIEIELKIS